MTQPPLTNAEPIPGYRLIERLGRGGFGEVWKAEAPGGMHKAIKFVFGDMDGAGDDNKGAEQEFRSLNRVKSIRHPFLLSLERIEIIDGQLLIVTELADRNLQDRFVECTQSGLPGVPRDELLSYMEEAAEALDLMNFHHQIQHLDIKPQNLFLVHRHVKVADFGLAKDMEGACASMTGGITPMYAPPETFDGWVSRQSDQYSLAIVYMEMLTGIRPFNGANARQLVLQHMTAPPDLAPLSSPDREAVGRALSKKPDDRFPNCAEFVQALRGVAQTGNARGGTGGPEKTGVSEDTASIGAAATQPVVRNPSKALPALVTQRSKVWKNGTATPRSWTPSPAKTTPRVPEERTGEGSLTPALIVGVGRTGLGMLQAFRQVIADRFGRFTLPNFRWLHVDSDPQTIEKAQTATPGISLSPDEVMLTNIQRPTHYLSRETMPPVERWLPSEELFRIPRTPATEGMRKIGRLALCDHYHSVCNRIRTALEAFTNNSGIEDADRITGLGLRSTFPRVYLATSLAGGTGSGMFLDLAYILRRELLRIGYPRAQVIGLLAIPAISSEVKDSRGIINARAALSELNYYSQPKVIYSTVFDTREGPIDDPEKPLHRCIFVRQSATSPKEISASTYATTAQIAYAELLTPLGRVAHPDNENTARNTFSVVGLQRVTWPRAYVLKAASASLIRRLLAEWANKPLGSDVTFPKSAVENQWEEARAGRAAIVTSLRNHLIATWGVEPERRIQDIFATPPEAGESKSAELTRLRETYFELAGIVGQPGDDNLQANEIAKLLASRGKEIASQLDSRFGGVACAMIEQPGLRLAAADEAIRVLKARIDAEVLAAEHETLEHEDEARYQFANFGPHLLASASEHAARSAGTIAEMFAQMRHWALARAQAQISRACAGVYRTLLTNLPEYVRETKAVRAQLNEFHTQIGAAPEQFPLDGIYRPVFPDAVRSVDEAAAKLDASLDPQRVRDFEHTLQARIRHEFRGVAGVCSRPKDYGTNFLGLLTDQAMKFLDTQLAHRSAISLIDLMYDDPDGDESPSSELARTATPTGLGQGPPNYTVIACPADSTSVKGLIEAVCPGNTFAEAPSKDDLILWRECRGLSVKSFPHLSATLSDEDAQALSLAFSRNDLDWESVPVLS